MTIPDVNGVIMITESQRESELIQEEIINHMRNIKVWYNSPKTTILTRENLGKQQNDLLSAWMNYEQMKNYVFDTWDDMGEEEEVGSDDN